MLDLEGGQWMRAQNSPGRVFIIAQKIQQIIIAMGAGAAEYQEAVRKMIKWVTLSFPNSVPLPLELTFTNQNVAQFAINAEEHVDHQGQQQPYNPQQAYDSYMQDWTTNILRTRQNLTIASILPGGARLPGPVLVALGTNQQGAQIIPPDTLEQSLLTIFPWSTVVQGDKQIYLNPQQMSGETIGGRRKKSRKRKQKGGKRKAKRRKSRKKRGGAPKPCANKSECDEGQICFVGPEGSKVCGSVDDAKAAGKAKTDARKAAKEAPVETVGTSSLTTPATPEEKVETVDPNEGEGTPEIIPAGEGEKILKEIEAKKKKAETTPAAVTSETSVETPAAVIPVETTSTVTTPEVTTPPAVIPVETTSTVTTPEVTTPAAAVTSETPVETPATVTSVETTPATPEEKVETTSTDEMPPERKTPDKLLEEAKKKVEGMTKAERGELFEKIKANVAKQIEALKKTPVTSTTAPAAGGYKKKKRRKKTNTKRKNKRKKNKSKKHKKKR